MRSIQPRSSTKRRRLTASSEASALYKKEFRVSFQLAQQMRQQGQSDEDLKFQTALSNI